MDMLRACDQVVGNCNKVIDSKNAIIVKQNEMLTNSAREIQELKKPPGVFQSPVFWFILGVGVTAIVTK